MIIIIYYQLSLKTCNYFISLNDTVLNLEPYCNLLKILKLRRRYQGVLVTKEVVQKLLEEPETKKVVSVLATLCEQTNLTLDKCKIQIKKWIMNSVSHNRNKSNYNTNQDHLVHSNLWANINKIQILNINRNNSANLPTTKTWFNKFLHKFTRTNLSTSKLFKKIK